MFGVFIGRPWPYVGIFMRLIGQIAGETKARAFGDFLVVHGVEHNLEPGSGDSWDVWIYQEESLAAAKEWLTEYLSNPGSKKFQGHASAAVAVQARQKEEQARYEKRVKQRQQLFRSVKGYGFGPLTFFLIFICAVVALNTQFKSGTPLYRELTMANLNEAEFLVPRGLAGVNTRISSIPELLPEINRGELWRLVTPIFLHFSLLHIFFNMLWLRDLGSMIEGRQGTGTLFLLVVCLAVCSNSVQYLVNGPMFGGMSGVVYGLEGYIWIRGKRDPASGLFLHPTTVVTSLIFFLLCFTGAFGPIANGAHTGGLVVGMAWGYFSSFRR